MGLPFLFISADGCFVCLLWKASSRRHPLGWLFCVLASFPAGVVEFCRDIPMTGITLLKGKGIGL